MKSKSLERTSRALGKSIIIYNSLSFKEYVSFQTADGRLHFVSTERHRQAETLKLLHQHIEGLRYARLGQVLALDDCLVYTAAAGDVVGLDREDLLQRVRG